jgi:hypothetical protein
MTDADIHNKESKFFLQFLLMCLIVIISIVMVYFLVVQLTNKPDGPGTFGDLFGVATCLFSGLAFSGLLYTVKIQKLELQITRAELRQTAEANKASSEAAVKTLEVQRLSSIISGRQALLTILTDINHYNSVIEPGDDGSRSKIIRTYCDEVKAAVESLNDLK